MVGRPKGGRSSRTVEGSGGMGESFSRGCTGENESQAGLVNTHLRGQSSLLGFPSPPKSTMLRYPLYDDDDDDDDDDEEEASPRGAKEKEEKEEEEEEEEGEEEERRGRGIGASSNLFSVPEDACGCGIYTSKAAKGDIMAWPDFTRCRPYTAIGPPFPSPRPQTRILIGFVIATNAVPAIALGIFNDMTDYLSSFSTLRGLLASTEIPFSGPFFLLFLSKVPAVGCDIFSIPIVLLLRVIEREKTRRGRRRAEEEAEEAEEEEEKKEEEEEEEERRSPKSLKSLKMKRQRFRLLFSSPSEAGLGPGRRYNLRRFQGGPGLRDPGPRSLGQQPSSMKSSASPARGGLKLREVGEEKGGINSFALDSC
ncbi:hypothetical protein V1477_015685 [Vespula maculifrons]|uniref:Uncharacterized protein n=1 Tax=Vespula maculifrons TaxID=7453 RepID=A0ABD2BAW4_VESMC